MLTRILALSVACFLLAHPADSVLGINRITGANERMLRARIDTLESELTHARMTETSLRETVRQKRMAAAKLAAEARVLRVRGVQVAAIRAEAEANVTAARNQALADGELELAERIEKALQFEREAAKAASAELRASLTAAFEQQKNAEASETGDRLEALAAKLETAQGRVKELQRVADHMKAKLAAADDAAADASAVEEAEVDAAAADVAAQPAATAPPAAAAPPTAAVPAAARKLRSTKTVVGQAKTAKALARSEKASSSPPSKAAAEGAEAPAPERASPPPRAKT